MAGGQLRKANPRNDGHRAGVQALRRLVACAVEFEINYLTIFSFSSENWTRPADEVNAILGIDEALCCV